MERQNTSGNFTQFGCFLFTLFENFRKNGKIIVKYVCRYGFKIIYKHPEKSLNSNKYLVCKNSRWIGKVPMCKKTKSKLSGKIELCSSENGKLCEHLCLQQGTISTCVCYKGFHLVNKTNCAGKKV